VEKIRIGLRALGVTEAMIDEFCALIGDVNRAVKEKGLITRVGGSIAMKPRGKSKVMPKKRRLVLTYKPKGTAGRTVADELEMLRERLRRDNIPDWQRRQLEARLDVLLRAHKTAPALASATLAQIGNRAKGRKPKPVGPQPVGLGKIAALTLARMGR